MLLLFLQHCTTKTCTMYKTEKRYCTVFETTPNPEKENHGKCLFHLGMRQISQLDPKLGSSVITKCFSECLEKWDSLLFSDYYLVGTICKHLRVFSTGWSQHQLWRRTVWKMKPATSITFLKEMNFWSTKKSFRSGRWHKSHSIHYKEPSRGLIQREGNQSESWFVGSGRWSWSSQCVSLRKGQTWKWPLVFVVPIVSQ